MVLEFGNASASDLEIDTSLRHWNLFIGLTRTKQFIQSSLIDYDLYHGENSMDDTNLPKDVTKTMSDYLSRKCDG